MVTHFNSCDIYKNEEFNIYSREKMLKVDRIHHYCRCSFLEYAIDHNRFKYVTYHKHGNLITFEFVFTKFRIADCTKLIREFISLLDKNLFAKSDSARDYIWFLQTEPGKKDQLSATVILFSARQVACSCGKIFPDIFASDSKNITDFRVRIPEVKSESWKRWLMMQMFSVSRNYLLDCGFAAISIA